LTFYENDVFTNPSLAPISLKFISSDCSISINLPLDIRLPSYGLVDKEAAEEFIENLIRLVKLERHLGNLFAMKEERKYLLSIDTSSPLAMPH
jgi:hypothetical protein